MPLIGIEITAAWKLPTAPREQVVTASVLTKESQPALNIGLERSNDCFESFIHGWVEQRLTKKLSGALPDENEPMSLGQTPRLESVRSSDLVRRSRLHEVDG